MLGLCVYETLGLMYKATAIVVWEDYKLFLFIQEGRLKIQAFCLIICTNLIKVSLCNSASSPFLCAVVWCKLDYFILMNIKNTGNVYLSGGKSNSSVGIIIKRN